MTIESKVYDITGKGSLGVLHTGGGIYIAEGDVQDEKGNNVYVMISEEGSIAMFKKNPEHQEFQREFIDMVTYHDKVLGETYYWGHEYYLEVTIAEHYVAYRTFMVSLKALEIFDKDTIKALTVASQQFMEEINGMRGWS